jgi:hypothetical protein
VLSLSVKLGQERDLKYKPLGAAHVGVQATWHNGNHIRTCTLISDNMHDLCVMCVGHSPTGVLCMGSVNERRVASV